MAVSILTQEQRDTIEAAVRQAEARTSGEIVPAVVAASDHYAGARWRVATIFAFSSAVVLALVWPEVAAEWVLACLLLGGIVGHVLAVVPRLLRIFLRSEEVAEEVRQRAYELFLQHNVHATRDRTGVLLLVSMLEHRIEILSDTAINSAAPEHYWDEVVADLALAIKNGAVTEGMVTAIGRIGDLLEKNFPPRSDDVNELSDGVVGD